MATNQQITFLADGGEDIRELPRFLNPNSEHLLDWFHVTMRLTVMTTMAKSLRPPPPDPDMGLTTEGLLRCLIAVVPWSGLLVWGQTAWASSSKAVATRSFGGESAASS